MIDRSATAAAALAAVLFDMDGTIVDTEPYWIQAEYTLVGEYGGSWSDEHAYALVGNALIASGEYIREHGGVDLPAEQIVARLLADVVARTRAHVPWRPGARELIAALASARVPVGLVTMSYAELADAVLADLPAGAFAAVVTGDQVDDGKPHPAAYLTAAARLGVDPRHCVAVEDSPTGVASAEAAGCVVVAVPHHVPLEPAPSRTIVASLTELDPDRFAQILRTARATPRSR